MLSVWTTTCEMLNLPAKGLQILIDNTAMGEIMRTGRNLTMKHISKTHGIQVGFLHEVHDRKDVDVKYITTTLMAADMYTKEFYDHGKWHNLCTMNSIYPTSPTPRGWEGSDEYWIIHNTIVNIIQAPGTRGRMIATDPFLFPPQAFPTCLPPSDGSQ